MKNITLSADEGLMETRRQEGLVCELAGGPGVFLGRLTSLQGAAETCRDVGLHRIQALARLP